MQFKANREAIIATLVYIGVAGGWILFSDELLGWLVKDPDQRIHLSILKGWVFVLVTGGWLYLVLLKLLRRWERELTQRERLEVERAQSAENLRQSEERLRLVLEGSADGMWDWDLRTDRGQLSARFWELTGYPEGSEPATTEFLQRLVHPEDWPKVAAATRENREGKSAQAVVEYRLIQKDGSIKWIWGRGKVVERGPDGTAWRMVGTISDITERTLAGQEMRESEERYRQLFELESDAVLLVDCETHRVVDANQSAQRLYGYSREQFLELRAEDISDEPENTRAAIDACKRFTPLRWHRKQDGSRFAVEISSNTISHQGRRTALSAVRDVTSREKVVEQLRETTEQLVEAQRIAGLGSYIFEVSTGVWTASDVLGDIFGLVKRGTAYDVKAWAEIIHPDDREEMLRYWHGDVLQRQQGFDRVYRIVRQNDRQERWVHGLGKLVLDAQGGVLRVVGVIQDITSHKRNEEQMNLQLSALTAVANAIVITDRRGCIEWVNPAFSRLTGYSVAEAVGSHPALLKSGEHPDSFYANLWATILTGNVWHGELINRRKDGQFYTEDMTITPVRAADGEIAHFVAVKQDVTEQRQLERRMQQAQKLEAIGTLAGGIAHDFNNILAAMYGYAYLLQQDTEGNAAAQENIGEILKATGRAKDLVQQILTFSRQREQKPQLIQLELVVKEAIKFLRASLPAQIQIDMRVGSDVPAVLADPTQIYQVAVNLATNALYAMEGRAGKLSVTVENFVPDRKFLQSHPELQAISHVRLTVADTGNGMDAQTLGRIFEPFFTTKPLGKGTGLGLSVVHGIVQAHHGCITVQSELGRGTTFELYFPGQEAGHAVAVMADAEVPAGSGQRILLLDDEPALASALQRLLQRLNYRVITHNHARASVAWCRENPGAMDLVITDLTMPEINGLEVARALRALRPDLPIILTSGFSADLNPKDLAEAGICELLEKPISRAGLAAAVQRALAGANGHAPAAHGRAHGSFD